MNLSIDHEDIQKLQSIHIPENVDVPLLTRHHTTTHLCCEKYSEKNAKLLMSSPKKSEKNMKKKSGNHFITCHRTMQPFMCIMEKMQNIYGM